MALTFSQVHYTLNFESSVDITPVTPSSSSQHGHPFSPVRRERSRLKHPSTVRRERSHTKPLGRVQQCSMSHHCDDDRHNGNEVVPMRAETGESCPYLLPTNKFKHGINLNEDINDPISLEIDYSGGLMRSEM